MEVLSGTSTTWRSRNSNSVYCCLLFLAALAAGCSTDAQLGRWEGHVAAVDVYDLQGKLYPAAGLLIERGPAYHPKGPQEYVFDWAHTKRLPEEVGGGRLPLLTEDSLNCIIPRDRLPVGQRVSVRGYMTASPVNEPLKHGGTGESVARYRPREGTLIGAEHCIIVQSIQRQEE